MALNLSEQIELLETKAEIDRKAKFQPVPIVSVAKLQKMAKPILSSEVMARVKAGIAATENIDKWKEWGFTSVNSVLAFTGDPGTGKTTTARWVARQLGLPLCPITGADIGSGNFGDSERNIKNIFEVALKEKAVLYFDECDALLWDRAKATGDSMWMLSIVNALLIEMEAYDGNIILSTNHTKIVDPAVFERVTFHIHFPLPDFDTRLRLWKIKWPKWPLKLTPESHELLAATEISGRKIEQTIREEARVALEEARNPSIAGLKRILRRHNPSEDQS